MKQSFMPGATPDERVAELSKICYNKGADTFQRTLTQSEIDVEKDYYFKYLNEENTLKEELKNTVDEYQKKIKAASKEKEDCFETVKTGQREVRDTLYWVIDEENGRMHFYDRYGELIKSRALTPEETNRRLFSNEEIPAIEENENIPGDVKVGEDVKDIADVENEDDENIKDADFEENTKDSGFVADEFKEKKEQNNSDVLDKVIEDKKANQEKPEKTPRKKKTDI